jgi:hypothetical protein
MTAVAVSPAGGSGRRFTKRCGVCAQAYEAIQTHLSVSAGWAIEVRSCACGAVLAARR